MKFAFILLVVLLSITFVVGKTLKYKAAQNLSPTIQSSQFVQGTGEYTVLVLQWNPLTIQVEFPSGEQKVKVYDGYAFISDSAYNSNNLYFLFSGLQDGSAWNSSRIVQIDIKSLEITKEHTFDGNVVKIRSVSIIRYRPRRSSSPDLWFHKWIPLWISQQKSFEA